ncbi:MAG: hypothetical protein FWE09_06465 [Treponema sp.]|nr:hypothetical protein [Treponema sp.]
MAGTIGVKVADGDFYPILDENSKGRRRLVLTTAHDGQSSVQLDFFRSVSKSMLDAQYVGSIVVEGMTPVRRQGASIELVVSSDGEGNVVARARDLAAPPESEPQFLTVSLRAMDSSDRPEDFPDFDPEEPEAERPVGKGAGKRAGKGRWPLAIALVFVLASLLGLGALLFLYGGGREAFPAFFRGPTHAVEPSDDLSP